MIRRRHRQGKKRHPDSIYEVEPVDFPGRRNDRRDCKVSIKNAPPPIKKSVPAVCQ